MSAIDLSSIATLTVQLDALQKQSAAVTDPAAKALLQAQCGMLSAQIQAAVQHAQQQSEASSNMLDNLGLFATLSGLVGNTAPTIINLFKR